MPTRVLLHLDRPGARARDLLKPLVRYRDWRWTRQGDRWFIEVDGEHESAAMQALAVRQPSVVQRSDVDLSLADEQRARALYERAAALCAPRAPAQEDDGQDALDETSALDEVDAAEPQDASVGAAPTIAPLDALRALLSIDFGATQGVRWQAHEDSVLFTTAVVLDSHAWLLYDAVRRRYACAIDRVLSVARRVWEQDQELACSLLRAFVLDDAAEPADTDFLMAAHRIGDLDPDLASIVTAVPLGVVHTSALQLREYQRIGAVFALGHAKRALIADSPGVGKTATSIAVLRAGDVRDHTPALVVAPASVLTSWRDEIRQWAPSLFPEIVSTRTLPRPCAGRVWIVSWAKLHLVAELVVRCGVRTVIADEAHYGRVVDSRRSRALAYLARSAPYMLALTGTPLENRVDDLWHTLHMLQPDAWPDREAFVARYGDKRWRQIGAHMLYDEQRLGMLPELRVALRRVMIRRRKSDVLADLPEKTRVAVRIDLPADARRAYDEAAEEMPAVIAASMKAQRVRDAIRAIKHGVHPTAALAQANQDGATLTQAQLTMLSIVAMGHLCRLVGLAKIGPAVSWIEDFVTTRQSLVVFVMHTLVGDGICAGLEKRRVRWGRIDGTVEPEERGRLVREFQAGRIQVLVCSIRAAGTGITLTRASHVLLVERAFIPAVEEQAIDRCHRVGQKSAVTAHILMANDTVDDRLGSIAATKERIAADVLGLEDVTDLDGVMENVDQRVAASSVGSLAVRWFSQRVSSIVKNGLDTAITIEDIKRAWR